MPEDKTLSVTNAVVLLFSVVNVVILGVFSKVATVVEIFCAGGNDGGKCGILFTLLRERNMFGVCMLGELGYTKHRLNYNHDGYVIYLNGTKT
jgi:hypothetical protein